MQSKTNANEKSYIVVKKSGVDYTLHGGEDKVKEKVDAITNGAGVVNGASRLSRTNS
ncbi:hypothetical protein [Paenibacillus amylolyticus]|uniref:hypothetical protein n=1 Tax=Paenibacillus amylolyticus TaxID=1451 RepID=UPI0039AEB70A